MLPALQKQVNRLYVTSVKDLCDFAYEAENVLEAERLYQPPPLSEKSVMLKSAYKIPSKKPNASKVPNAFKASQPSKPAVRIAAAAETTDKTDLANLVATLTEKIYQMELELKRSKAPKQPIASVPTSITKANAASTPNTPKPKKGQKTGRGAKIRQEQK